MFKKFVDDEEMPDMPRHGGVAWPLQKNLYEYRSAFFDICRDKLYNFRHSFTFCVPYSKDLFSRRTGYKIPKDISKFVIDCIRSYKFK